MANVSEKWVRVAFKHLVGGAMDGVAGGDQVDVPLMIALEGGAVAVMAPAIGFNDDLLGGPEEVDEMALDQNVADWGLHIHLTPKGEEIDL